VRGNCANLNQKHCDYELTSVHLWLLISLCEPITSFKPQMPTWSCRAKLPELVYFAQWN